MANKRIDQLPVATQINDADLFVIEQSNTAKSVSGQKIKALVPTSLSQLSQDSTHRVVTDAEKTAWNGKIDKSMTATATGLAAGATPTVNYNSQTNVLSFGIPKGDTGETGPQGPQGEKGDTGATGPAGKSAYESAQDGGYTGTEQQFNGDLAEVSNKADKPALARTDRSLDYLWKKSEGIIYDTETVHSNANTVTVPSGAMEYASMDMVGGMSMRVDGVDHLIDAKVDKVVSKKADTTTITEKTIPQAVIAICPDYGIGVNADCYNYIDWVEKKYHHKVGSVDLGALDWIYTGGKQFKSSPIQDAAAPSDTAIVANIKVQFFNIVSLDKLWEHRETGVYEISLGTDGVRALYGNETSADVFKTAMSGVMLHYELATEEIIDLSSVIPEDFEIIQVEAGGTIQFHYPELDNGYSINVPNDMTYMVNVAEVTL